MTEAERQELLAIARASIAARVIDVPYEPPRPAGALARLGCAFVTLRIDEHLRGCIGSTEPTRPLAEAVARCAAAAATEDPRFPAMTADQLQAVRIEISVLTPMQHVSDIEEIEVGRHGLLVSDGVHRGLLLPQVATEWGWNRDTFLAQTCLKAGLPRDAWRTGATVLVFEAEIFEEG